MNVVPNGNPVSAPATLPQGFQSPRRNTVNNMNSELYEKLRRFVQSFEGADRFATPGQFLDEYQDDPAVVEGLKNLLLGVTPEDLDGFQDAEDGYGEIAIGLADYFGLLPVDERLFIDPTALTTGTEEELIELLGSACILGDLATVQDLAQRVDVNRLDNEEQTALGYAVGNGRLDCVKALLSAGADPNRPELYGGTALHVCALTRSSKEIMQMLIAAGGDLSVKNDDGETPVDFLRLTGRLDWIDS
jgi:hypothetical protein